MIKMFEDGSYIEIKKTDNSIDDIVISLCSIDPSNTKIVTQMSVQMKMDDLKELISKMEQ